MLERFRSRWVLGGAALVLLMSAACVRIAPAAWSRLAGPETDLTTTVDGVDPNAVATAVAGGVAAAPGGGDAAGGAAYAAGRGTAVVRRGSITEVVQLTGRVTGQEEVPLSMTSPGRVQSVSVKPGQAVDEGAVLLEVDSKQIQRDLSAARARLDSETTRLRQAQAQAQAKAQDDTRKQQVDQATGQRSVSEAQSALIRAQADFDRVKGGAAPADRNAADAAVAAAQAALDRAQADLARLTGGPSQADLAAAQQVLTTAKLGQQKAEADLARLQSGANAQDVRTAQAALSAAQSDLQKAQADLNQLTNPDPDAVKSAQREVERAQITLQSAQSLPASPGKDSMVATAQLGLKDAQDKLAKVQQPPPQWQVDNAKRAVDRAQLGVDGAQERLNAIQQGPDQLSRDTAQATVDAAKLAVQNADDRVQALQAGPQGDAVTAAQNAVNAAQAQLAIAQQRRDELLSHPTPAELQEAQAKLNAAQAAYDGAKAQAAPQSAVDLTSFDLQLLQQSVDSAQAQADTIERELAATKLRAPFGGTVASVQVRAGDPIEPAQPVVTLSKSADAVVRADLTDSAATKVQVGQQAVVQLDTKGSAPISAAVTAINPSDSGAGTVAVLMLGLPEGAPRPAFGANAQVSVSMQSKDGVLLIPAKAVRTAGTRRYVEYVEGTNKRIADVQTGITSGGDVEVTGGLTEGQTVVVPQQVP